MSRADSVAENKERSLMVRFFGCITHRSQSILEYTVILAAIIAGIILGARIIGTKVQNSFTAAGDVIDTAAADYRNLTGN